MANDQAAMIKRRRLRHGIHWILSSTVTTPKPSRMATRHRRLCAHFLIRVNFAVSPSIDRCAEPNTIGAANILMPRIRLKHTLGLHVAKVHVQCAGRVVR